MNLWKIMLLDIMRKVYLVDGGPLGIFWISKIFI